MSKIALVFPGIGYHTDKPLLYFSKKLAKNAGYEIKELKYHGFPKKVKGDQAKMRKSYEIAMEQTCDMTAGIDFSAYEDVLILSKSIGTTVALAWASQHKIPSRHLMYTPLLETFQFDQEHQYLKDAIAFHGTSDPWAKTEDLIDATDKQKIPMILVPDSNHSLETGDVNRDLENLQKIMIESRKFIEQEKIISQTI